MSRTWRFADAGVSSVKTSVKWILMGIAMVLVLGLPCLLRAGDWLHFGHNDCFTGYSKNETTIGVGNVKKLKRLWGTGCNDGYFSTIFRSPAIFQGTLFTSGAGDTLTAYNTLNGHPLWKFGQGNTGWAPQPVVSSDGIVFYMEGTDPTYLYAVKATNGKKLWKAPIGLDLGFDGAAYNVPVVDEARNAVYVVENSFMGDGKLYAFNKKNGKILWYKSKAKDGMEFRGNYVALKGPWIFATAVVEESYFERDKLARINSETKKVEMYYDRPTSESYEIGGCAVCNNMLIVTYHDRDDVFRSKSILAVYKINSRKILWTKVYNRSAVTGAVACNTDKNTVYVPTNPYLYAYNMSNGKQVWKYTGLDAVFNPSIANGIVYFLSKDNFYAINEATGKKLFHYSLGYEAEPSTQVAVADGMIYFSGNGGDCDLFALGFK